MINDKKKVAVITDTGCDMPSEIFEQYNVKTLPLRIVFSDTEYANRDDIPNAVLYERMKREYPKTSLPTRSDIYKILDELCEDGYTDVLYVSISSKLSGSFNAMRIFSEDEPYRNMNFHVVDTKTLSVCQGYCVMEAVREVSRTNSVERAIRKVKDIRNRMTAYIILPTLEYILKGGRISRLEGTLGSILHLNPILGVDNNGDFETMQKTIGFNRAYEAVMKNFIKKFDGRNVKLGITHGSARSLADKALERLKKLACVEESFIEEVSPVLGVHTGSGLLGVVVVNMD